MAREDRPLAPGRQLSLGLLTERLDIEVENGSGYTVGGGGVIFSLDDGTWTQASTPTGANLKAVRRGDTDMAVGAAGTIIEK